MFDADTALVATVRRRATARRADTAGLEIARFEAGRMPTRQAASGRLLDGLPRWADALLHLRGGQGDRDRAASGQVLNAIAPDAA